LTVLFRFHGCRDQPNGQASAPSTVPLLASVPHSRHGDPRAPSPSTRSHLLLSASTPARRRTGESPMVCLGANAPTDCSTLAEKLQAGRRPSKYSSCQVRTDSVGLRSTARAPKSSVPKRQLVAFGPSLGRLQLLFRFSELAWWATTTWVFEINQITSTTQTKADRRWRLCLDPPHGARVGLSASIPTVQTLQLTGSRCRGVWRSTVLRSRTMDQDVSASARF